MGKYAVLIGQAVYTVFERKVYKGVIEKTCYQKHKNILIVKWGKPLEGVFPKKDDVNIIENEYSTREIGTKFWFRLSDVAVV